MGFLGSWFKKNDSDNYEEVLSSLALDIQKRQQRLSEIRLRERRSTLLVTIYALGFWGAYLSLWYTHWLPNLSGHRQESKVERAVKGIPVIAGPIVILFTRRIVQLWYARIGNAEEKTLKSLLHRQRSKVEEIKKKTNYYSTVNLIERYDNPSPSRKFPSQPQPQPQTPQLQPLRVNPSIPPHLQSPLSPSPQSSIPSPRKQWYDRVADSLLGADDDSATSPASKYALICSKCFAHNGLVKESLWEDTQYTCPKCGHFNPSPAARRQEQVVSSPKSESSVVGNED